MRDSTGHAGLTERLARVCAGRPWRTLAAWLLAVVLAVVAVGAFLGGALSTEARVTNDPESLRAYDLVEERFPERSRSETTELIVIRSDRLTFDDPAFQTKLEELVEIGRGTGSIAGAGNPLEDERLISPDRHAVLIPIRLEGDPDDSVGALIEAV